MLSSGDSSQEVSNGPNSVWIHARSSLHHRSVIVAKSFTSTSPEDYDRHHYKLILKNGKAIVLEDYESARNMWFQMCRGGLCERIEVVDK